MRVKLTIHSQQLTKEELQHLIQSIRDCEQRFFRDKEIYIWIEVPELTESDLKEILASIKPPYKYGPLTKSLKDNMFLLSVSAFEVGLLMGTIMQAPKHVRDQFPQDLWQQLLEIRKHIEQACGVTREYLPGGMLKLTDADGNVIIREPYPWEIEGN